MKKKPGPAPSGKGTLIGVRLQPETLAKIDDLRNRQSPVPTRPEVIRQMIAASLEKIEPDTK